MAVNTLATLVERNVNRTGVVGTVRLGAKQVNGQTPASLSYLRHPSHRSPRLAPPAAPGSAADFIGERAAALRAGRPRERAGVLVSQTPARVAGRREPMAMAGKSFGVHAKRPAVAGLDLRQHPLPSHRSAGCAGLRREWRWVRQWPAQGMPAVSTRGLSARHIRLSAIRARSR
jgi:hypothetical protein